MRLRRGDVFKDETNRLVSDEGDRKLHTEAQKMYLFLSRFKTYEIFYFFLKIATSQLIPALSNEIALCTVC